MEPVTLSAAVGALLAPYVKKAAEAFAGEAGKYALGKATELWSRLRSLASGDAEKTALLDKFEADPETGRDGLEHMVQQEITGDAQLCDHFARILSDIKRAGPELTLVQEIKEVEEATALEVGHLASGSVDLTQKIGKADRAIGAKIDTFGDE